MGRQDAAHLIERVRRQLSAIDSDRLIIGEVAAVAAARGVPKAQVALARVAQHAVVTTPIVGASKPRHLDDARRSAVAQCDGERDETSGDSLRSSRCRGSLVRYDLVS